MMEAQYAARVHAGILLDKTGQETTVTLITDRASMDGMDVPVDVAAVVVISRGDEPDHVLPIDLWRQVIVMFDKVSKGRT